MDGTLPQHRYHLHGLQILSEISLGELPPYATDLDDPFEPFETSVHIRLGEASFEPRWDPSSVSEKACFDKDMTIIELSDWEKACFGRDMTIIDVPGVATYRIDRGQLITVQPAKDADLRKVQFYLYARAFAALLYQRQIIPLHASAIVSGRLTAALVGHSGAGKSSLASALVKHGGTLITDDVLVLRRSEGAGFKACRGLTSFHLSDEAASITGHKVPRPEHRIGAKGKHYYAPQATSVEKSYPLHVIYFPKWHSGSADHLQIKTLRPYEALMLLRDNAYIHLQIKALGLEAEFFSFSSELVRSINCFVIERGRNINDLDKHASSIAQHLHALERSSLSNLAART
jgi:hypothetical protein